MDAAKQRKKYVWMIIIGFAGPFIIFGLIIIWWAIKYSFSGSNTTLDTGGVATYAYVLISLLLDITAFISVILGPVIGIIGIIKLFNLSKQQSQSNPEQHKPEMLQQAQSLGSNNGSETEK